MIGIPVRLTLIYPSGYACLMLKLPAAPMPGTYVLAPGFGSIGLSVHSVMFSQEAVIVQVRHESAPSPSERTLMLSAGWELR